MKKPSRTYLRKKADKLCSQLVRARGACENCGRTDGLQWAHGFSRRYLAIRYDLDNSYCLCLRCHKFFTERPLEWTEWMAAHTDQKTLLRLQKLALAGGRPDYPAIIARLQERLEAVA